MENCKQPTSSARSILGRARSPRGLRSSATSDGDLADQPGPGPPAQTRWWPLLQAGGSHTDRNFDPRQAAWWLRPDKFYLTRPGRRYRAGRHAARTHTVPYLPRRGGLLANASRHEIGDRPPCSAPASQCPAHYQHRRDEPLRVLPGFSISNDQASFVSARLQCHGTAGSTACGPRKSQPHQGTPANTCRLWLTAQVLLDRRHRPTTASGST